ncbi:FtsX-like permease family protein [Enterococcus sp. LJL90]
MKTQKEITSKLWKKSFAANKRRNVFVILAIALTTLLITSVISLGSSFVESNNQQMIQYVGTVADASVNNLSDSQLTTLKDDSDILAYGQQTTVATVAADSIKNDKVQLLLHWFSKGEWQQLREPTISDFVGSYPEKENEVLVPIYALEALGITKPKIGMEIPVSFTVNNQEISNTFRLSGYYTEYISQRAPEYSYLLVSDAFKNNYLQTNENVFTSFKYQEGIDIAEANKALAKQLKLTSTQEISATLRESTQDMGTVLIGIVLFLLIILISGGLLIYNVLYISVANDIRFFGLLKAVGTTKKQLRKIVLKQALLLAIIGIPIGLLIGTGISFLLIPFVLQATVYADAAVVSLQPLIYLGASLFSFVMTLISAVKPANFAAKVSPVLALHYTEGTGHKKQVHSLHGGKLSTLAWRNIFRDKKRALVVIVSLFLGITSFVAVNTVIKSIDFEKFVLSELSHDVTIDNSQTFQNDNSSQNQAITQSVKQLLDNQTGISNVAVTYRVFVAIPYEANQYANYLDTYNDTFKYGQVDTSQITTENFVGEIRSLSTAEAKKLIGADFDSEAFENGEFALVQSDKPQDFKQLSQINYTEKSTQSSGSFAIGGFIPTDYQAVQTQNGAPVMFIAENYFHTLFPVGELADCQFDVAQENETTITSQLESILSGQQAYVLTTKLEMSQRAENETLMLRVLGNTLAIILILIGLLNFVNILTTSILARKQELATMESIGMTRKQVIQMLTMEGSYYSLIITLLVSTFGMALTYGIFLAVKQVASYASFTLPVIQIIVALLLVFILGLLVPRLVMKEVGKGPLAERIKN